MENQWAFKRMSSHPRLPLPGHKPMSHGFNEIFVQSTPELGVKRNYHKGAETALTPKDFTKRLSNFSIQNPTEWESYILNNTRIETLNKWVTKKMTMLSCQKKDLEKTAEPSCNKDVEFEKNKLGVRFRTPSPINLSLQSQVETENYNPLLHKLCSHLNDLTMSSGFSYYFVDSGNDCLLLFNLEIEEWKANVSSQARLRELSRYPIGPKTTVASYVAFTKQSLIIEDVSMDERFPKGIAKKNSMAVSVMSLPLALPTGDLIGVLELHRNWEGAPYTQELLNIVKGFIDWSMLAIYKTQVNKGLEQQTEMSKFLLEVSRTYLDDITNIDNIVQHIMRFAKDLVSAERCSLFLYEKETGELCSNFFDAGEEEQGKTVFIKQAEMRFPISEGIAGYAAKTKNIINVADAYSDTRFNREVDKLTGYTTKSVLCIPIMGDDEVYGVVEMINKKGGGAFTNTDQGQFHSFAVFCAMALRYAKVHARLLKDQSKYEIIREQYLYHSKFKKEDYDYLLENIQKSSFTPADIEKFHFVVRPYQRELPTFFVKMLRDLIDSGADQVTIPDKVVSKFVLTVRNNYRDLPYHNWYHAMTVCQTMYCLLMLNKTIFDVIERFAMLVAALCHDIDHRSMSNQFLSLINHPLVELYPVSTLENHHIQLTMDIMEREDHDILCGMSAQDKEKALTLIRSCILATDLATYFENQVFLDDLLEKKEIDFQNPEHRSSVFKLIMTACDISSTTKPWEDTKKSVEQLYNEFWMEGDCRKQSNLSFVPMMDRNLEEEMASGQVNFYSIVVIKCYETLSKILSNCKALEIGAKLNLERWGEEADQITEMKQKLKAEEEQDDGRPPLMVDSGGLWMVDDSRFIKIQESKLLLENM